MLEDQIKNLDSCRAGLTGKRLSVNGARAE